MTGKSTTLNRAVYIVDGARTPFLKAKGKPGNFSASDLAVNAGQQLLLRQNFKPSDLGEVVIGNVMPSPNEANIARIIALRLGCGQAIPAWTVARNCASGMQALDSAMKDIATGRHDLVLAGGTEAMSHTPLLFNDEYKDWIAGMMGAKTLGSKLKAMTGIRPSFLKPIIALLKGLHDPVVNLSMGQTAENLAYRFGISRTQMDQFSYESHRRVASAQDQNFFAEIEPEYNRNGEVFTFDDGVRRDSSVEKLATLKPFFDKKFGNITPGNSSQVTDGAAMLLLASKEAIQKYNLPVLAKIVDVQWAGVDPAEMGLGPVYASYELLKNHQLNFDAIDYWELNEAFAAQVLACQAAFQDGEYCRKFLRAPDAIGELNANKLNIDGGAIALGHPVGASGARIALHLTHILKRKNAARGIATICIGGGQGGAMLIENVSGV